MVPVNLNLVEDIEDVKNPADGMVVIDKDNNVYHLIWICPSCGQRTTGKHKYDRATRSLHPSIVHNLDLGGCGWHGWLTDGLFKDA
jgi:transposase